MSAELENSSRKRKRAAAAGRQGRHEGKRVKTVVNGEAAGSDEAGHAHTNGVDEKQAEDLPHVNGDSGDAEAVKSRSKTKSRREERAAAEQNGVKEAHATHDNDADPASILRKAKKAAKKKTKHDIEPPDEPETSITVDTTMQDETMPARDLTATGHPLSRPSSSDWRLSEPRGGRYIAVDPVFARGEKYILLATAHSLRVYSVETSLLQRSLRCESAGRISSFALSRLSPDHVYVATLAGDVTLFNWSTGTKTRHWKNARSIRGIAATFNKDTSVEVLTIHERSERLDFITAQSMPLSSSTNVEEPRTVYTSTQPLQGFELVADGQYIVATQDQAIVIGEANHSTQATVNESSYVWREVAMTDPIACFDIRIAAKPKQPTKKSKQAKSEASAEHMLNVAIGCLKGQILIYEDFFGKLAESESSKATTDRPSLTPRIIHWHREAVSSLKWSLDGNYIISGGIEPVLCLWQLETGKRTELPHLSASIDCLTVSPSGARYALQLADNSIIVLSTSELKPTTHIAGVQTQVTRNSHYEVPQLRTVNSLARQAERSSKVSQRVVAAADPRRLGQVVFAIPASQPRTEVEFGNLPAPFMQSYDVAADRHAFRQAMTRNNTTVVNIGPNRLRLKEPTLKYMQLSSDGKWLASVEEWVPPISDVHFVAEDRAAAERGQAQRRETYLKFWLWSEEKGWMLEARIDDAHQSLNSATPSRILDLQAEPVDIGFATIGEDGMVKVWRPKTKMPNGSYMRGIRSGGVITWSAWHAVKLEKSMESLDATMVSSDVDVPLNARLAFSKDGSVLAASQDFNTSANDGLVHFIDTFSGRIEASKSDLFSRGLLSMAFAGHHLVTLSSELVVWDTVNDSLAYGYALDLASLTLTERLDAVHLAVNHVDDTFAIAMPMLTSATTTSEVCVFNPTDAQPLFATLTDNAVTAMVGASGSKGYVVLDSDAELRLITPGSSLSAAESSDTPINGQAHGTEATNADAASAALKFQPSDPPELDDGKPVVRSEHLAELFEYTPSFALPPVMDMFTAVVSMYSKRPASS